MTHSVFTNRRDRRPHAAAARVSEALAVPHPVLSFGANAPMRIARRREGAFQAQDHSKLNRPGACLFALRRDPSEK